MAGLVAVAVLVGIFVGIFAGIGSWALWLFLETRDKGRIADYLQKRGGRLVLASCCRLGERQGNTFEVVYDDQAGDQHFAVCKVLGTAVYWTDDRVTHPKDDSEELRRLREENARLRQQLAGATNPGAVTPPESARRAGRRSRRGRLAVRIARSS
jgi:hypothetical protein